MTSSLPSILESCVARCGTIDFVHWFGRVLDLRVENEVEVRTSGGGGYLDKGSGYVAAPTFSARNVPLKSIWLERLPEKTEKLVKLGALSVECRAGHFVSIVYYSTDASPTAYLCFLVNHSTGSIDYSEAGARASRTFEMLKLKPKSPLDEENGSVLAVLGFFAGIGAGIYFGIGWWTLAVALAASALLGGAMYALTRTHMTETQKQVPGDEDMLKLHIEKLAAAVKAAVR